MNSENLNLSEFTIEQTTPASLVPESEINKLIDKIEQSLGSTKLNKNEISVGLAIICQKGGTAKKAQPNIYANINGKKLELGQVRKAMTDINWKYTLRQLARTKANFIYTVSNHFSIQGDLAQKLGRNDTSLTTDEKIWLSNFQMDNPDCPEKIRNMLSNHYNEMFSKQ